MDSEKICGAFRQALEKPPERMDPSMLIRELPGWDSLARVLLVAKIHADHGVQVSAEELGRCASVGDLLTLVQGKIVAVS